jgi:hypothetical protein
MRTAAEIAAAAAAATPAVHSTPPAKPAAAAAAAEPPKPGAAGSPSGAVARKRIAPTPITSWAVGGSDAAPPSALPVAVVVAADTPVAALPAPIVIDDPMDTTPADGALAVPAAAPAASSPAAGAGRGRGRAVPKPAAPAAAERRKNLFGRPEGAPAGRAAGAGGDEDEPVLDKAEVPSPRVEGVLVPPQAAAAVAVRACLSGVGWDQEVLMGVVGRTLCRHCSPVPLRLSALSGRPKRRARVRVHPCPARLCRIGA